MTVAHCFIIHNCYLYVVSTRCCFHGRTCCSLAPEVRTRHSYLTWTWSRALVQSNACLSLALDVRVSDSIRFKHRMLVALAPKMFEKIRLLCALFNNNIPSKVTLRQHRSSHTEKCFWRRMMVDFERKRPFSSQLMCCTKLNIQTVAENQIKSCQHKPSMISKKIK